MSTKEIPRRGASLSAVPLGSCKDTFSAAYVLGEKIGEGKFGSVYKTHHKNNESEFLAVKIEKRPSEEKAMLEEVSILHKLQKVPNVVQLIDFYIDKRRVYTVQALAEGGDLLDRIAERKYYTENCARDLALILLVTISNVHGRGVVHRDLKPENLLLESDKNDAEILLCDFGYAKLLREDRIGKGLTTVCGTPEYMAPEIWKGETYGKQVDAWSVGCILFILLGGYFPFGQDRKGDLYDRIVTGDIDFEEDECWDAVSNDALETVVKLLEVDPEKRWTSEQALASNWFTKRRRSSLKNLNLDRALHGLQELAMRRKFRASVKAVISCNLLRQSSLLFMQRETKAGLEMKDRSRTE